MTIKYHNVYINYMSTTVSKNELEGPLSTYYDIKSNDPYFGEKTWEEAEIKMNITNIKNLNKNIKNDINLFISGDLSNQIAISSYVAYNLSLPYLGIYNACASSVEGLIIASNFIEKDIIKNCICNVSSHNSLAEKQYRYPVEYGGPKRCYTTFTATASCSSYLSKNKEGIKVESSTIGKVNDATIKDVYNMGGIMTISAIDTLITHLKETNRDINYYDLVLTGDLGVHGKKIFKTYLKDVLKMKTDNIDDAGSMIYDINKQDVYSGGSGPVCLPLVLYSYLYKTKKYKKILLLATGALMSPTTTNEKFSIPSICHALSVEVV